MNATTIACADVININGYRDTIRWAEHTPQQLWEYCENVGCFVLSVEEYKI